MTLNSLAVLTSVNYEKVKITNQMFLENNMVMGDTEHIFRLSKLTYNEIK